MKYLCLGQCGAAFDADAEDISDVMTASGWTYLPVARAGRCNECCAALLAVQGAQISSTTSDELESTDLGALKPPKEHSVIQPRVKP